jgi:hypothetical protein
VQQFIREELAANKGERTVQLAHNTLRTALKQAELWGLVPRNGAVEGFVGLGLHNTNRHDTIHGPAITVPPFQAKVADSRLSCRKAVLDAIERLHQRTGATEFARRAIVAEIQATGVAFERQTIYRCLRRLTGHEPGSAHHDLEDLGSDHLRRRSD